jgi:hypothetical protein
MENPSPAVTGRPRHGITTKKRKAKRLYLEGSVKCDGGEHERDRRSKPWRPVQLRTARMRRHVRVLANFLIATKDLTTDYARLAGLREDELDQLREIPFFMSRPDRKTTAKLLSAKGMSTREIARITGWSHMAIARDLAAAHDIPPATQKGQQHQGRGVTNVPVAPPTAQYRSEARKRRDRQATPPAVTPAVIAETLAALGVLGRLLNRDPSEIVEAMTPEGRAEAVRLAPLVAEWLGELGSAESTDSKSAPVRTAVAGEEARHA